MSTDAAEAQQVDVIVLAGGTGKRLGGASKPEVVARGARLVDHVLRGLRTLAADREACPLRRIVVVAPPHVPLPSDVVRALEDPPLGGPVAGIAAGLAAASADSVPAPLTALLACDAPESWRPLPALVARMRERDDVNGVVPTEPEADPSRTACPAHSSSAAGTGIQRQYLMGVYRTAALRALVAPQGVPLRDVSVYRTFAALTVAEYPLAHMGLSGAGCDLDTWEDVAAWDKGH